jgi:hypothetical protein
MQAHDLKTVLLIQAVEETDRSQEVLGGADRLRATRSALDAGQSEKPPTPQPGAPLQVAAEGFLARRAQVLLNKLESRAPVVGHLLAIAQGDLRNDGALIVLSFACAALFGLVAGGRRINLFAPPLLALLTWNLIAYARMLARALQTGRGRGTGPFWFGRLYSRWLRRETDSLLKGSTRFNAPLTPGLKRFTSDWWASAQPLLELRARALLHFCAALAAVGLVAGIYMQALVLHDPAGWGGAFLEDSTARALLAALYGPASALTGIAIPSAQGIGLLRWHDASGGGEASVWAHLIAVTATLYIIVPRLVAALVSAVSRWQLSQALATPPGLVTYARLLLEGASPAREFSVS